MYENLHYLQYVQNSNLFTEKTNDKISRKVQKTQILDHFGPEFAQKKFFSKIGLSHILSIAILHHCAKNQKKQMTKFREKSKKPNFGPF